MRKPLWTSLSTFSKANTSIEIHGDTVNSLLTDKALTDMLENMDNPYTGHRNGET
jgi:hypothetical protein